MNLAGELKRIKPLVDAQTGNLEPTVYGVIDRVDKIDGELVPNIIRRWRGGIGDMHATDEEPTVLLVEKLEPFILKSKKYKCLFGGRGGMKTRFAQNVFVSDVHSSASKIYVLRERMTSLKESIYSGVESTIRKMGVGGFLMIPSRWEIRSGNGGKFVFGGMQNILDMKGANEFKRFLMEEAENTSQKTIDTLGPTLRDVDDAELWYLWNTGSSQDPMSKEFILPYQAELDRHGYYEDDHHMIVKLTYEDNPWFMHDKSLREELKKDKSKVERGIMTRSRFNGIWLGAFNDDVINPIISEDWFESCVDAHKKLGFDAVGGSIFGFDPADVGSDAHGYALRHGRVFTKVGELEAVDGNRAADEAVGMARNSLADTFRWDCDGLGATLRDNVARGINGTRIEPAMFKGSESPERPNAKFSDGDHYSIKGAPTNKDCLKNKRAQGYVLLASAMRKTHEAVQLAKTGVCPAIDVDSLISFDSEGIQNMSKLKSELCRLPLKPSSGHIALYSKDEMRKGVLLSDGSRIVIPSPNMGDSVMMCMFDVQQSIDWGDDINYKEEFIP